MNEHYEKYKENYKKRALSYYEQHPEKCKESAKKWAKNNPEKIRIIQKTFLLKRKMEIFKLLGNKCANPFNFPHPDWCNDIHCLQIDHINGGGCKEIKSFSNRYAYYNYVISQIRSGSKDYQLLCANCNWIKRGRELNELDGLQFFKEKTL